jgi:glycosyltransferase 2 family protein
MILSEPDRLNYNPSSPDPLKKDPPAQKSGFLGLKRRWPLLLMVSVVLSLLVPLLLGGLRQFSLLSRLHRWAAVLFIGMIFFSWLCNSQRLRLITGAMGPVLDRGEAVLMTAAAEFAGVATPASIGMAGTYTYLFKQQGVSLGHAMGMLGVVVVTDLLVFASLMPCAALAMIFERPLGSNAADLMFLILATVAVGALALFFLSRNYRRIYRFLSRRLTRVPWLATRRYLLARMTVEFVQAFRLMRRMSWRRRFALYFSTVGYWLPRYGILLITVALLGEKVPYAYLFLAQGVLNLGGQMFILPGGGGGVDAGYAVFLSPYMGRETLALTLLVWRTFTFYWYLLVGGLIFSFKTGKAARRLLSKAS